MKTDLKLKKITISKLDNFNFEPLKNEQLQNVKGGAEAEISTVHIVTIGGTLKTYALTSCAVDEYTECMSRDS